MADHAVLRRAAVGGRELPAHPERRSPPPRRPAARRCIPGYGFLAENPAFVEACVDNDLVFVGPPADVMALMGDKISAKQAMRAADVPTVPGHRGRDVGRGGAAAADEMGFPLLLKATRGRRRQGHAARARRRRTSRTRSAPRRPRRRRRSAIRRLYVEKALVPARHVEIQVLCDDARRRADARRARVLDPAPPPEADRGVAVGRAHAGAREEMEAAAERACRAVGYRNAGTFEFLLGPDGSFYFIELNARLQVEHPVTEIVHRHRPRARAAARRRRRAARRRPAARRAAGTRSRSA